MNPRVKEINVIDDYKIKLFFTNGELAIYDCKGLLNFGVFKELNDKNYFLKAKVIDGTIVWPNDQDICPDTLYLDSVKIT